MQRLICMATLVTNLELYQFDHLDTSVQEQFEQFLNERGINSSLALFIPTYAEYKEQKVRIYIKIMRNTI